MRILGLVSGPLLRGRRSVAAWKKVFGTYEALSQNHRIVVLNAIPIQDQAGTFHINRNFSVIAVKLYYPTIAFYLDRFKASPLVMVDLWHRVFAFHIKKWFKGDYDVYQFDSLLLTGWAKLIPSARIVVYAAHNVEYDWFRPVISNFVGARWWLAYMKNIEKRICERAELITVLSSQDRKRINKLYGVPPERMLVVPMGYRKQEVSACKANQRIATVRRKYNIPSRMKLVLFCGSDAYPNRIALDTIVKDIRPGLDKSVLIIIAGTICREMKNWNAEQLAGLLPIGFVKDINEVYAIADLSINPVTQGSGANVKVIEYLAAGLDLVTTRFGLRGYEELADQVFIAEPQEMSEVVNGYFRGFPGRNDKKKVERFAWENVIRSYDKALRALS